ncbi:transmembrane protein 128-like [Oscarella lobularis]|uniref:transmembrane protein 128-like n=1 Tax=Oscarella lobularis TaxID=121494 RepID=UPI00331347B1
MNSNLRYRGSGFGNEETQKVKRLLAEELSREDDEIESKPLRYLDSALWLVGSGMALYYTDFFRRIFTDPTVKFYWFYSGLVLLSIHIGIGLYLILFIGSEKWDTETRFSIPVATVAALVSFFCFVVGLWPLWGLLTPLLLFTFVMGVVTIVSLLPGRERSEKNKTELEKL